MTTASAAVGAVFFVLIVLTTFVPYPAARADAIAAEFTEYDIDIGLPPAPQAIGDKPMPPGATAKLIAMVDNAI